MVATKLNKAEHADGRAGARGSRLSLYPLDFEAALGAALKTGKATDSKGKKPAAKTRKKPKSR